MSLSLSAALTAFAAAAALYLFRSVRQRQRRRGLSYPPGPKPLPIVGNLFDLPKENSWVVYAGWEKTYGGIISLQILGQVVVVLNSQKAIRDLLEKRGAKYSDRPVLPFFDMMGLDWAIPLAGFNDLWRTGRKTLDRSLRPNVAVQFRPMQKAKTHAFLRQLLLTPDKYREHIEHLQGAMLLSVGYGYDVKDREDMFLSQARELSDMVTAVVLPGSLLVNDLPFLRHLPGWLPGMAFKQLAVYGRNLAEQVITNPFNWVKDAMESGSAQPSLALDTLLENQQADAEVTKERDVATALASLYAGGSDTSVSALSSFILALILYPDVQARAHAEIDAVTGGQRLPDFDDRPRLPYIDALCKELLRWRMVTPIALPHAATEDDVYEGYFIPKGAIVIGNAWALLHDPVAYPDPEAFKPERFLTKDGQVKDDPTLAAAFGFGKRICPGRHLVDSSIFIIVASVLSLFYVDKAKDQNGKDIPVKDEHQGPQLSSPVPFRCTIVPRHPHVEEMLSDASSA
ncbi:cytochrome P450 [Auriscalpium vulgare]|uniref:Cytochrome P450 n=1 Tax=Auriscalpium vulgare TaxID=40419 RepID=A0ACB8R862_9AGAM|nr:cytochrome P450 [Auriscalpium vulgare]